MCPLQERGSLLCMALTYDFDGHCDQRSHEPVPIASREAHGLFPTIRDKIARSQQPTKSHYEAAITTGGEGQLEHFNTSIQPHASFSTKTNPAKARGLRHATRMPAGIFRALPASVHGAAATLVKDGPDVIARPRAEGEEVALHAASGVGPNGVACTMLCTLAPERRAETVARKSSLRRIDCARRG